MIRRLLPLLLVPAAVALAADAADNTISVKGTCVFSGKSSTWSAKLTPKADGTYDAAYDASWGGKPLTYKGTMKSDWKTEVSGEGTNSNGTFQFSGKFNDKGIANCPYKEVGGRGRSGTLTVTAPEKK